MEIWTIEIHEEATEHDADFVAVGRTPHECLTKWQRDVSEWQDDGMVGTIKEAYEYFSADADKTLNAIPNATVLEARYDIWWCRMIKHSV